MGEVEDVKVEHIVEPKKKLTKKDLKTSVKIKGLAQSEEKVRRRKPKEPLADETMEKKPSFEDIPHLPQEEPQLDKDKSKVRDQFTEKSKTTAVEESIVIEPTVLPEVQSAPDERSKISDHFLQKDKAPKEEEKIVISPRALPQKDTKGDEAIDDEEKKRKAVSDHFAERQKKDKGDEEKIIIKPSALPEKQKSKPETDDEAEEKERKRVSDHFAVDTD